MTVKEIKAIYVEACRAKRIVPQEGELSKWNKALSIFESRDVQSALDAWWKDTTATSTGRPRGAYMPEPAELKPLVEEAARRRMRASSEPKVLARWQCPACGLTMTAFVPASDLRGCNCRRCHQPANEIYREKEPAAA